jgi:hypothetical protein
MFLENEFAEPLFSFHGGQAKAFKCKLCRNKVFASETGMRAHLKYIHNWEEQPCLSSMESQTVQNNIARKKPQAKVQLSQNQEKQDAASTDRKEMIESHATKEGELLMLMKEEKSNSQMLVKNSNSVIAETKERKQTQDSVTNTTEEN